MEEMNLQAEELENQEMPQDTENNQISEQPAETGVQEIQHEEVPVVNIENLSTEEIVEYARKLVEGFSIPQIKDIMDKLTTAMDARYKAEYNEALAAFTADGSPAEDFKFNNNSKEEFNHLYKSFRDKRSASIKQAESEREENLRIKLQLIDELKELIQREESLNKTFQEFKEIQERWRNTGMVPQSRVNDLLETYHLHVENFYNYIKINKELRDLDLKHNLDEKTALCEEAEKLLEHGDINEAFKHLQLLHARWKEIGPVPRELKDSIWERFKTATDQINEKYHNFFENLKKEQENNLKVKEDICEKAAAVASGEYTNIGEWNKAAQRLIDMQEEWKHTGTVPLKERNKVYKKFRASCDLFFDRKREFFKGMQGEQEKNLQLKFELCEKVEALKDSTDWKVVTDKIIAYQKEWKKIGPAPQKHSNKVWNRFRAACDEFFNRKKEFFKDIDEDQEKNLELKKALLEEVKQFVLSDNNEENIKKLKEYQARWSEIGFVPIKEKENIQEEFRSTINAYFDKLNLDEFDRKLVKFKTKLQSIDSGENKEFKIVNEREKLVSKIRQLETDIHTWENNIGFFTKSRKSEGLLKELQSRIEKTKQQLALLQEKLKALDNII